MTEKKPKPPPPWLSGFCGADLPDESHARCRGEAAGMPCVCRRPGVHSTPHLHEPPPVEVLAEAVTYDPPEKPADHLIYPSTADASTITGTLTVSELTVSDVDLTPPATFTPSSTFTAAGPEDWLAELGQHLADGLHHPPPVPSQHAHDAYRAGWHAALTYAIRGLMYGRAETHDD